MAETRKRKDAETQRAWLRLIKRLLSCAWANRRFLFAEPRRLAGSS